MILQLATLCSHCSDPDSLSRQTNSELPKFLHLLIVMAIVSMLYGYSFQTTRRTIGILSDSVAGVAVVIDQMLQTNSR